MNFGEALAEMRKGVRVERLGWSGRHMWVTSAGTGTARLNGSGRVFELSPFFVMKTSRDDYVPWAPTSSDLLADDWMPSK